MAEINSYEPADIEIYLKEKGMVFKEKSLIAFTRSDGKILAVGKEAEEMAGKEIKGIQVISPLRQGMIADYAAAVGMLQLTNVYTREEYRSQTIGTQVLNHIKAYLTDIRCELIFAWPSDNSTKWYARNGFCQENEVFECGLTLD